MNPFCYELNPSWVGFMMKPGFMVNPGFIMKPGGTHDEAGAVE